MSKLDKAIFTVCFFGAFFIMQQSSPWLQALGSVVVMIGIAVSGLVAIHWLLDRLNGTDTDCE